MKSPCTKSPRRTWRVLLLGPVLVGVLGVAGCGSNPQEPSGAQATGSAGSITVQSMYVVPPNGATYAAGSSATAEVVLFNSGRARDVLLGASSPRAASALLQLDGGTTKMLNVPADNRETAGIAVVLQGLTSTVKPGSTVPVTLQFKTAGAVTLNAPVRARGK